MFFTLRTFWVVFFSFNFENLFFKLLFSVYANMIHKANKFNTIIRREVKLIIPKILQVVTDNFDQHLDLLLQINRHKFG